MRGFVVLREEVFEERDHAVTLGEDLVESQPGNWSVFLQEAMLKQPGDFLFEWIGQQMIRNGKFAPAVFNNGIFELVAALQWQTGAANGVNLLALNVTRQKGVHMAGEYNRFGKTGGIFCHIEMGAGMQAAQNLIRAEMAKMQMEFLGQRDTAEQGNGLQFFQDGSKFPGVLQKRLEAHFIIGAIILLSGELSQQGDFVVAQHAYHVGGFDQIPDCARAGIGCKQVTETVDGIEATRCQVIEQGLERYQISVNIRKNGYFHFITEIIENALLPSPPLQGSDSGKTIIENRTFLLKFNQGKVNLCMAA
jgi:hypothetical protein